MKRILLLMTLCLSFLGHEEIMLAADACHSGKHGEATHKFIVEPMSPGPEATLVSHLARKINHANDVFDPDLESSTFSIINLGKLDQRVSLWNKTLSDVSAYFAVKSNPDYGILRRLCSQGVSFDVATIGEIKLVRKACHDCCQEGNKACCIENALGDRMVFANPRKESGQVSAALRLGIDRMVLDSIDELHKIRSASQALRGAGIPSEPKLILRLKAKSHGATIDFASKFGADCVEANKILKEAADLNPPVKFLGISFHIGTNTLREDAPQSQREQVTSAIKQNFSVHLTMAHKVLAMMQTYGHPPKLLDIGGGWLGANDIAHQEIANIVREELRSFRKYPGLTVIAEPGRFFSTQTVTLGIRVNGVSIEENSSQRLYLSDGTYGFLHDLMLGLDTDFQTEFWLTRDSNREVLASKLFGPTCDSLDEILPGDDEKYAPRMEPGDFFIIRHAGAYTSATRTHFNEIAPGLTVYTDHNYNLIDWEPHHR